MNNIQINRRWWYVIVVVGVIVVILLLISFLFILPVRSKILCKIWDFLFSCRLHCFYCFFDCIRGGGVGGRGEIEFKKSLLFCFYVFFDCFLGVCFVGCCEYVLEEV